jgi:alpha-ribazole phosphatase
MRVIVVRHYKTVNNVQQRIMGWGDAPPAPDWEQDLISVEGRLRARGLGFDAVYSSRLERAKRTAGYFAVRYDMPRVTATPALNEVNYGRLYQKPKSWVIRYVPEYKTDPDFVYPEGESFRQMQRRSVDFLVGLEKGHRRQILLLVVHAGVIRGLVCHFLGLDFAMNLKQKVSHRYIGDFVIEDGVCVGYDELGKPSGFVAEGVIEVPYSAGSAAFARSEPNLDFASPVPS